MLTGLLHLLYDGAAAAATLAAHVTPPASGKLAQSLRGRRGLGRRYAAWAAAHRVPARPLLWMHAPSVGEGLQARPVLQLARRHRPDLQLAYTYFSPSAANFSATLPVDFRDFLPFDTRRSAAHVIAALAPAALVFSKLDVWPNLVEEASRRGVRLGLISATLAAGSARRGRVADAILRDAYAALDAVGAIDAEDAERLMQLGVLQDAVRITGDTRYDQVWERCAGITPDDPLVAQLAGDRPTLVAGSTWPSDERELLAAWSSVRRHIPDARLVIAPHEPTRAHLEPIERWGREARLTLARLADAAADADVVLVDRVGVLGALYALADVAYVGGGFHDAGLHSVLEPAAFGAPVLYGPRFGNSRDAMRLTGAGGRAVHDRDALAEALQFWLTNDDARRAEGDAARELVRSGLGAAERSWALVSELLPGRA